MQNELKLFEGLGFTGWMKLVFRSRAATIKQCDNVTRALFDEMQKQQETINDLRTLVRLQGETIKIAKDYIADVNREYHEHA